VRLTVARTTAPFDIRDKLSDGSAVDLATLDTRASMIALRRERLTLRPRRCSRDRVPTTRNSADCYREEFFRIAGEVENCGLRHVHLDGGTMMRELLLCSDATVPAATSKSSSDRREIENR
jgi:hypothetical protein